MRQRRVHTCDDPAVLGVLLALSWLCCPGLEASGSLLAEPPNPPGSAPAMLSPDLPYAGPLREDLDMYGGWTGLKGERTGFFHLEQLAGRWWLVTPEGNAYFLVGMREAPESPDRLRAWGFNCVNVGDHAPDYADDPTPYILNLRFIRQAPSLEIPPAPGMPPWLGFHDVFDPAWPGKCQAYAAEKLAPHNEDPRLVGFWIDNEPRMTGWYECIMQTGLDSFARKAFVEVAREYYADKPGQLAEDWQEYGVTGVEDLLRVQGRTPPVPELARLWEVAVAERTFSTVHAAREKHGPKHLNLGVKMMSGAPPHPDVLKTMGRYCDALSFNLYSVFPDRILTPMFTLLPALHQMTGRPVMTSEFSYRGGDTILPNTTGAPPTVKTQTDRAVGYLSYMAAVASMPFYVGATWYTYHDDAAQVTWERYDEDCNFGIVDRLNRPYAALVEAMKLTNSAIYELAADPKQDEECPLFWNTRLTRWDLDWSETFIMAYARAKEPLPDPLANLLPERRRFHENYWVAHRSPAITINDDRFFGVCQANIIKRLSDGFELSLLGVQTFTGFPRELWHGPACDRPQDRLCLETNAGIFVRRIDSAGSVLRMTLVDGSFVRTDFASMVLRADRRVPYAEVRFDHASRTVTITTRGALGHLGVAGVKGWRAIWNGTVAAEAELPAPEAMAVFAHPGQ